MKLPEIADLLPFLSMQSNCISDEGKALSYQEIYAIIEKISEYLDTIPLNKCSCLGVNVQNDVFHVVSLLTILRKNINVFLTDSIESGGAYPAFCDYTLHIDSRIPNMPEKTSEHFYLRKNRYYVPQDNELNPGAGKIILPTSGSTGSPKYVCYSLSNLVNNAFNVAKRLGITARSKVLVPVPVTHMYGLGVGLLPGVITGAEICLIEKNNVLKLFDKFRSFRPDTTLLTPTTCEMLLQLNKPVAKKQIFVTAGARLSRNLHESFEEKIGKLINLYGCTELGAIATSNPKSEKEERIEGALYPMNGVKVKLNKANKGEIICKHPAGFDFYLDKLGHKIPFGFTQGGWYRTRDMGKIAEDQSISVLGRTDFCVNRNGFLTSLLDIETQMEAFIQDISKVIVIADEKETIMGPNLLAFCQLKAGKSLDIHAARNICRDHLAKHIIPDEFYFVEELPKLSNGKPDRVGLKTAYHKKSLKLQ